MVALVSVGFRPRSLYEVLLGTYWYQFNSCGEEKICFSILGIKLRFLGHSASSLDTIPTKLFQTYSNIQVLIRREMVYCIRILKQRFSSLALQRRVSSVFCYMKYNHFVYYSTGYANGKGSCMCME
jgi:hypothetical protein